MENLEALKLMQKVALRNKDFATLNKINTQLFELREKAKREKAQAKEEAKQNNFNNKILQELERGKN